MDIRKILGKLDLQEPFSTISFSRFICLKRLNFDRKDCADFETRFCCLSSTIDLESDHALSLKRTSTKDEHELNAKLENVPLTKDDLSDFSLNYTFYQVRAVNITINENQKSCHQ